MGDKDDMTNKEQRLAQLKEKWYCRCGHLKSLSQCGHEDSGKSDSEREEAEHVDDDTNGSVSDDDASVNNEPNAGSDGTDDGSDANSDAGAGGGEDHVDSDQDHDYEYDQQDYGYNDEDYSSDGY